MREHPDKDSGVYCYNCGKPAKYTFTFDGTIYGACTKGCAKYTFVMIMGW